MAKFIAVAAQIIATVANSLVSVIDQFTGSWKDYTKLEMTDKSPLANLNSETIDW